LAAGFGIGKSWMVRGARERKEGALNPGCPLGFKADGAYVVRGTLGSFLMIKKRLSRFRRVR